MKKTLLILIIGLVGINNLVNAQFSVGSDSPVLTAKSVAADGDVVFGYCNNSITNGIGLGDPSVTLQAAINLTTAKFGQYAGKTIRAVRIGVKENIKETTVFIRTALEGQNVYSQEVGTLSVGWNTIYLETPFTVPAGDFYVGYSCSGSYPMAFSGTAVQEGCYLYDSQSWGNYRSQNWGSLCFQVVMNEEVYTNTDVRLVSIFAKDGGLGQPVKVNGSIQNNSTHTVTNFGLEVKINGDVTDTQTLELPLKSGASGTFNLEIDNPVETEGEQTIEITVVSVDDVAINKTVDNSQTATFILYTHYIPRKVLLEYFTTQSCGNCPPAQARWRNVLSTREDVIWVAHHVGYYTDIFTVSESSSMLWFYNAGSYAPASMLDRTNLKDYGAENGSSKPSPGPVFFPGAESLLGTLSDIRLGISAEVSVDIKRQYEASSRSLTIEVTTETPDKSKLGNTPRLNIYLTEEGLIANQSGGGTNFEHNHVIRKFITPTWGDDVTYSDDNSFSKSYTFTLPAAWKSENMHVVAFVSNYNSANVNDCNVYNAESVSLDGNDELDGIVRVEKINATAYIYGNSLVINADVPVQSIAIYNVAGQKVLSSTAVGKTVPVERLSRGIYLVKLKTAEGERTVKIIKV
ncbi:MAG: Omp28-related outer membrane protein [Candidatus Symbiothrix sp.]|jgi:hypothetical protein|nr:Omp28-related outer membrane protein [Candidatus Symbiothrix sp.]